MRVWYKKSREKPLFSQSRTKLILRLKRKPERSVREHVEYQQRRYPIRADLE